MIWFMSSVVATNAEDKSETSSQESHSSAHQELFAEEVIQRDKKCLVCSSVSALEACVIVDVHASLSEKERMELKDLNVYHVWNGITLCATCHDSYNYWRLGIDEDGHAWMKERGKWTSQERINVYSDPSFKTVRRYPDPMLLKWKFERFEAHRDEGTTGTSASDL